MCKDKYPNIPLKSSSGYGVYHPSNFYNFATCALLKLGSVRGWGGGLMGKVTSRKIGLGCATRFLKPSQYL